MAGIPVPVWGSVLNQDPCKICSEPNPAMLPLVKLPLATGADIGNLHFASHRLKLQTAACSGDRFRPNDKIILFRSNCCPWTCLEVLWQFCICLSNCQTSFLKLLSCATCRKCANLFLAPNSGAISFTFAGQTHVTMAHPSVLLWLLLLPVESLLHWR